MPKSLPPLTWFRTFEAAARRLSLTAAAKEIGLTQSALSQQIKALESRLGVALFRRHARGLTLTDEGRKLLPQVEAALETLKSATARYLSDGADEQITVAASVSVIDCVIAPALPQFRALHPDIAIRFVSTIWPDEFAAPRADIEIRFGSERQVGTGAVALHPNRLIAVKSPSLAGSLQDLPLIAAVGVSDSWQSWAEGAQLSLPAPCLFADSYGLALRLATFGNGVALISSVIAGDAVRTGRVKLAHEFTAPATEGYFLSVQRETPQTLAFSEWLIAQCA